MRNVTSLEKEPMLQSIWQVASCLTGFFRWHLWHPTTCPLLTTLISACPESRTNRTSDSDMLTLLPHWSLQARDISADEYVALKEVTIDREEGTPSTAIREIAYVKSLKNFPNVVRLLDVIYSETKITIVLELCKQDLKHFMDSFKIPGVGNLAPTPQPLPSGIARDLAYQLLCGVQSLHENRIIHRDLKVRSLTRRKI
jgi:serine/threonine protein kinase